MDNKIFKNQYALERMIAWLINSLELNLCQFDLSEKDDSYLANWKKISISHPEKGNCANLPPLKIYLAEIETPGKNHNERIPWIFISINPV